MKPFRKALVLLATCSSACGSGGGAAPHDGGAGEVAGDTGQAPPPTDGATMPIDRATMPTDRATMPTDGATITYSTTFDGTESPISENGAWVHLGLDWAIVATENGIALGTQTGKGGYDDSYAHLTGFPPDQSASAVIHRIANIDPSCTHEVEIHLRWSDAAHDAHGYECNMAWDGAYAEIVRWNGKLGDFTYLARGSVPGGVRDGDTISASIVGDVIVLSHNGVEVTRATDSTFKAGNPGMGFWRGGACGTRGDYGFTSFSATSR